jgi:hypothetical protein
VNLPISAYRAGTATTFRMSVVERKRRKERNCYEFPLFHGLHRFKVVQEYKGVVYTGCTGKHFVLTNSVFRC